MFVFSERTVGIKTIHTFVWWVFNNNNQAKTVSFSFDRVRKEKRRENLTALVQSLHISVVNPKNETQPITVCNSLHSDLNLSSSEVWTVLTVYTESLRCQFFLKALTIHLKPELHGNYVLFLFCLPWY